MVKLTSEQEKILKSNLPNIIIEAAPGSGKTEILAQKIVDKYLKNKKPFIKVGQINSTL